jgi:hypothetical protein
MKKNITDLFLVIIVILLIVEGIFIIKNSKDIKELKKQEETELIDERIDDTTIDKSLIGTWKSTGYKKIYIVKIDKKGNAEYSVYIDTEDYKYQLKEMKIEYYFDEISEHIEYLDDTKEYMLSTSYKGVLNNSKIVYKNLYTFDKGWQETDAKTINITKTSDYTIKVEGNEFGKQS